jgi:hypothetical protein
MRLCSFADFRLFMIVIPGAYNKDGATYGANACAASDTTISGIFGTLVHFRHFPVYPG